MNANLADAIRTRVASEVAASLQPHLEILRSLMGAIEAHPTFDRRPGVARSAETAIARATPAPKARRRSGHSKTNAATGAGTPGEPTTSRQLEEERPSARADARQPAHPEGATTIASTAGTIAPPLSAGSAAAALPEKATSALALPRAPPSRAPTVSPDTRGFHIDQPVRLRRPQGFVEATVVQIDPSTGLLELELVDEGRYVRVPAEKVFAAPG
jgi:hypothetical protein